MSIASDVWEVVGGSDKGGIIVRYGKETSSPLAESRLATGARVQQLELVGHRLHYLKVSGIGPDSGWVSIKLNDKVLLARVEKDSLAVEPDPCLPALLPAALGPTLSSSFLALPASREQIRVCTWNLLAPCYHRDRTAGKEIQTKFWRSRVESQISAILDIANSDLLCLQELWFSPTVLGLLHSKAEERGYEVITCRRTGQKMDGVAMLVRTSRFQVLSTTEMEICSMGNRVALWVLLKSSKAESKEEQHILAGTTHFTFPHGEQEDSQRHSQSKKSMIGCYELINKNGLDPESTSILFAGDFNCESGPVDDEAVGVFVADGWRSAFAEANGKEASATHRTHRSNHACADLVLVSGPIHTVQATLLPVEESDWAEIPRPQVGGAVGISTPMTLQDWSQLSDHRPLVATFSMGHGSATDHELVGG